MNPSNLARVVLRHQRDVLLAEPARAHRQQKLAIAVGRQRVALLPEVRGQDAELRADLANGVGVAVDARRRVRRRQRAADELDEGAQFAASCICATSIRIGGFIACVTTMC